MSFDQEVLDRAAAVEQTADGSADHSGLAELFRRAASDAGETDPWRVPLIWETQLYEYQVGISGEPASGFLPIFEMANGQTYPQPFEQIPQEAIDYFIARLNQAVHPVARARLADLLWLRQKQFHFADAAIAAYVESARSVFASKRGRSIARDYLGRATHLALSLRRDLSAISDAVRQMAQQFLDDEDGHLVGLLRTVREAILLDPALAAWLLQGTEAFALKAAVKNPLLQRSLLEALIPIATKHGGVGAARALRERIAQSLENEAQERAQEGGIVQSSILQDAIKAYADLGRGDKVDLLKPLLHEATRRSTEEMQRVSTPITIPTEELAARVDHFLMVGRALAQDRGPAAHFLPFMRETAAALWPAWDAVRTQTAELAAKFPFQHLVSKVVITADGRPHERPADPEQAREFEEIQHYLQLTHLSLLYIRYEVDLLREQGAWTPELLLQALARGAAFDHSVLAAVQPGVRAFEEGRHWEALHVLVPQIERTLRKLAVALGADTRRYVCRFSGAWDPGYSGAFPPWVPVV